MTQKTIAYSIAVLAASLAISSPCSADVTGTVRLANGSLAKNAAVWLEGADHAKPLKDAMVDQRDLTFIPHVSMVTQGTTVRFPNDDMVYHNVFAEFNAKKFDLGMYPRGSSKKITFDKCGVVDLLCSVHSEMSAYIVVVDTPYFAVADSRGRFTIRGVAAGSYVMHVWHEAHQSYSKSVTVGANSDFSIATAHD